MELEEREKNCIAIQSRHRTRASAINDGYCIHFMGPAICNCDCERTFCFFSSILSQIFPLAFFIFIDFGLTKTKFDSNDSFLR